MIKSHYDDIASEPQLDPFHATIYKQIDQLGSCGDTAPICLKFLPILLGAYYSQNYASIICQGLVQSPRYQLSVQSSYITQKGSYIKNSGINTLSLIHIHNIYIWDVHPLFLAYCIYILQWNPSILDTLRTASSVLIKEGVLISGVSLKRGSTV